LKVLSVEIDMVDDPLESSSMGLIRVIMDTDFQDVSLDY
jgi:hypothetical protein